jgi:signal transduction histidine kinase
MFQRTESGGRPAGLQRTFPTSHTVEFPHIGLQVNDIGVGAHHPAMEKSDGIGMANIRSRVGLVNDSFYIYSQPGHGTTHTIEYPQLGLNNCILTFLIDKAGKLFI